METLTAAAVQARLTTQRFGHPLYVYDELPSTNTTLRQLAAAGVPEGTVVAAARQTAGRGRMGRTFCSPPGGLYMSLLLRPERLIDAGLLTSCAAVAVCRAIESLCPLTCGIKWVNDIWVDGKKVCGILAEGVVADGRQPAVVIGIGVNVSGTLPSELQASAATLRQYGARVAPAALLAAVLEQWERVYAALPAGDFLEESRRRSVVLGRRVTVTGAGAPYEAFACGIDDTGRLLVRTDAGEEKALCSGEVSIRMR